MLEGMNFDFLKNKSALKELWGREKTEYRSWIIASVVSYLVVSLLLLTMFILRITHYQIFVDSIYRQIQRSAENQQRVVSIENAAQLEWGNITILIFRSIITLVMSTYFAHSVYKSYQKRDFSNLAGWTMYLYMIVAIYYAIFMLSTVFGGRILVMGGMFGVGGFLDPSSPTVIKVMFACELITMLLVVFTYFVFIRKTRQIRLQFALARRSSEFSNFFKKEFAAGFNPEGEFDPYRAFDFYTQQRYGDPAKKYDQKMEEATNETQEDPTIKTTTDAKVAKFSYLEKEFLNTEVFKKISLLEKEKLEKIAKKLSIVGYETFSTEELRKKVLQIYEQEWQEKRETK